MALASPVLEKTVETTGRTVLESRGRLRKGGRLCALTEGREHRWAGSPLPPLEKGGRACGRACGDWLGENVVCAYPPVAPPS